MDHATAETLLEDWIEGRLAPEQAAELEAHVRSCAECAAHADLLRGIRREVAAHGEALFMPHPSSDQLARLELRADSLPLDELARIGAHVRACPACTAERALIRDAARPAPLRAIEAWLATAGAPPRWLAPALAAMLVLLVWPAWVGLVEYPRAREKAERVAGERSSPATPEGPSWTGGGAGVLVLTGVSRGGGAALPVARLHPGQPGLAILSDQRLEGDSLRVVLLDAGGHEIWATSANGDELWDGNAHVTSLMVPARVLVPGEYELAISSAKGPRLFQARFRITTP